MYDVTVRTWVYTKNADGTTNRPDEPEITVLKAKKSNFSSAFTVPLKENASAFRIEVSVPSDFFGHEVSAGMTQRV